MSDDINPITAVINKLRNEITNVDAILDKNKTPGIPMFFKEDDLERLALVQSKEASWNKGLDVIEGILRETGSTKQIPPELRTLTHLKREREIVMMNMAARAKERTGKLMTLTVGTEDIEDELSPGDVPE